MVHYIDSVIAINKLLVSRRYIILIQVISELMIRYGNQVKEYVINYQFNSDRKAKLLLNCHHKNMSITTFNIVSDYKSCLLFHCIRITMK